MPTNEQATMHLLDDGTQLKFKIHIESVKNTIELIKQEHNLEGNWALSDDYRWLIKIGDQ